VKIWVKPLGPRLETRSEPNARHGDAMCLVGKKSQNQGQELGQGAGALKANPSLMGVFRSGNAQEMDTASQGVHGWSKVWSIRGAS
jgi:hypothetical protein